MNRVRTATVSHCCSAVDQDGRAYADWSVVTRGGVLIEDEVAVATLPRLPVWCPGNHPLAAPRALKWSCFGQGEHVGEVVFACYRHRPDWAR